MNNSKTDKRCGKCKWWRASRNDKGKIIWTRTAPCKFLVQWPTLPTSYDDTKFPTPVYVGTNDGKDCLCFEAGEPGSGQGNDLRGPEVAVPHIWR